MKKVFLTIVTLLVSTAALVAQPVLREASHGVLPGYPNPMILTKADAPGDAGRGVVWDFSAIPQLGPFQGEVLEPSLLAPEVAFATANSCLVEDDLQAFMQSSRKELKVLGLRVQNNGYTNFYREYSDPVIKMKYPFRYGNSYAGVTQGAEYYGGRHVYDIDYDYTVKADGSGKLILPGSTLEDVLRVVTTVKVTYHRGNYTSESTISTYRWYVKSHRYPVLSLIFSHNADGTLRCVKAAYNPVVEPAALLAQEEVNAENQENKEVLAKINARPNPFTESITVDYTLQENARVIVALYNLQGFLVKTLYQGMQPAGEFQHTFTNEVQGFPAGVYVLRVEAGGKALNQRLLKL